MIWLTAGRHGGQRLGERANSLPWERMCGAQQGVLMPALHKRRLLDSLATVMALACVAMPARAQTTGNELPAGTQPADAVTPTADSGAQPPDQDIVVTGSRIVRTGVSSPTPVVSLGSDDILKAGSVTPGDLLRQLPALAPGTNSQNAGVSFNAAGLSLLDLRNLGTNRTLTLVNGRRQVASNVNTASVDTNTVPAQLIERVEVITGGASAVYGADAVSGVVNFVLKRNYSGFQVDGQTGVASRGDAKRYLLSGLAGTNFAEDRGNVVLYAGYSREGEIAYDARPGGVSGRNWVTNPASRNSSDGVPDYLLLDNVRQIGGQQTSAFLLGGRAYGFNADGSVRPFALGPSGLINGGQYSDGGEAELGYDAACPQAKCILRVPVTRYLISGNAHFEAAPYADLFMEARFADTKTSSRFGSVFEIPPVTNSISITNPYVSPSLRTLLQTSGVTSIGILRSDQELGLRGQDNDRRLYQLVGGSRGSLGFGNFKYEGAVQYGSTRFTNTRINDVDQARFQNTLNVVQGTDGVIRCASAAAIAQGCVPVNLLQPGKAISDAALAYIKIPYATETADLSQFVASGNVTGSIGNFWGAGDIAVAAGVEYRREKSVYLVSPVDAAGQGFFFTKRLSTRGKFDVFEYFAEAVVPLLKDLPLVKRLEVEGAVRRSDYSSAGKTTAWKLGGTWAPVSDLRFRAVLARAVRAPNIGELFSPASEGFITVDDPCDTNFVNNTANRAANCRALGIPANFISNARTINIRTATSGNPDLSVETANTLTVGAVLTPRFLPGFAATVDFYRIRIKDAINVFAAQDILNNCVDQGTTANPFCGSIERGADGSLNRIVRQNINVSRLDRRGIDAELTYRHQLGGFGLLNLQLVASRALTVTTVVAPGTLTGSGVIDFNGEFGFPKWKGRFSANVTHGPVDWTGTLLYQSSQVRDRQPTNPEDNRALTGTGDYFLVNTQVGVAVTPKLRMYVGVDNLADRLPPSLPDTRLGGASATAGAAGYSIEGRYFYGGFTVRF